MGARIQANGGLYDWPILEVEQGCSLSPLLFTLAIGPLAHMIRSSPETDGLPNRGAYIHGWHVADVERSTGPNMQMVTNFGKRSGLTINGGKSLLLDSLPPGVGFEAIQLQLVRTFKYLDINVTPRPQSGSFVWEICNETNTWCRRPLSPIGLVNLIKRMLCCYTPLLPGLDATKDGYTKSLTFGCTTETD